MLDLLLNIIKENSLDAVVNNTQIPNEHNEGVQKVVMSGIQNGLSSALSGGNVSGIMDLFSQGSKGKNLNTNPIYQLISKNVSASLKEKFGLNEKVSDGLITSLLPTVLSKFSQKTTDSKDSSIDMNSIIGSLTGGKKGLNVDFNNILNEFTQKGKADGLDLGSIGNLFSSASSSKDKSQDVAKNVMGALGGFFKK